LISGKGEISSRLPAFSLFLPGTCPNTRDRRSSGHGLSAQRWPGLRLLRAWPRVVFRLAGCREADLAGGRRVRPPADRSRRRLDRARLHALARLGVCRPERRVGDLRPAAVRGGRFRCLVQARSGWPVPTMRLGRSHPPGDMHMTNSVARKIVLAARPQTKGAETDMPDLPPPRHFPTPPVALSGQSAEAFVLITGASVADRPDTGLPNCHRVAVGSHGHHGATSRP